MQKTFQKSLKKSVDTLPILCYYNQARLRAPNLENDTEYKKRKNDSQEFWVKFVLDGDNDRERFRN